MRLTVKEEFVIAEIHEGAKSVRVTLGDKKFKGNMTVFVDKEMVKDIKEMDIVEVEMSLTKQTRRIHDRNKQEAEFLEVISSVFVNKITKK